MKRNTETKRNGKRNDDPLPNMKIVFKSLLLSPNNVNDAKMEDRAPW